MENRLKKGLGRGLSSLLGDTEKKVEKNKVLIKDISRNKLSIQVDTEARKFFNEKVYKTVIPRNVRLSEAPSHGIPILVYDKLCAGSKSYSSFADEFLSQENVMESAA